MPTAIGGTILAIASWPLYYYLFFIWYKGRNARKTAYYAAQANGGLSEIGPPTIDRGSVMIIGLGEDLVAIERIQN